MMIPERTEQAPEWAHRLLTAFLTGEPLNFGQHSVPRDIQDRLEAAYADGTLVGVPMPVVGVPTPQRESGP